MIVDDHKQGEWSYFGGSVYTVTDLAVKTSSNTSWTTEAGSMLVQHVPSLKFMWSLQYMFSRIWESHDNAAALTCRPSDIEERKPDARRRDDDQMWTELRNLRQVNVTTVYSTWWCNKPRAVYFTNYSSDNDPITNSVPTCTERIWKIWWCHGHWACT